jgi:predicted PurR-regulated permease PerM
VGRKLYGLWDNASKDLEGLLVQYEDQIIAAAKYLFSALASSGTEILGIMLALVIAGILLATSGTREMTYSIFSRLAGEAGLGFAKITEQTIKSVVKGVLGVSFIQAAIIGIGFFLAGVPYAGLWTLLVLILVVVQLPATFVTLPVVIYLFNSDMSTGMAIFWAAYQIAAGLSDNVLKPILLGKGASVPMMVIFIGSIGGFMAFGFIGLFVGAIVLSIVYKLFLAWIDEGKQAVVVNEVK